MPYKYNQCDFCEGDCVKIIVRSLYKWDDEPELIYEGDVVEIEESGFWWREDGAEKEEHSSFADVENVMLKTEWWRQQLVLRKITIGCRVEVTLYDSDTFRCRITNLTGSILQGNRTFIHFDDIKEITLISNGSKVQFVADCLTESDYEEFEDLADRYNTTVDTIIKSFVHDLLCTNQSGGSDERDRAQAWFHRNCIGKDFIR